MPFTARRHRASAEGRYLFGSLPNFLYAARVAAMAGRLLTDSNGQLFLIVSFSFSMSSHSESDSGHHEEEFHAIGRGLLNIENLPVYRDAIGGIGTPTSDEERTKLTPETSHLLMLINVYDKTEDIEALRKLTLDLFQTHCNPRSINTSITSI